MRAFRQASRAPRRPTDHPSGGPNAVLDQSMQEINCVAGGGRCTSSFSHSAACNDSCCTLPATHTAIRIIAADVNIEASASISVQKKIHISTDISVTHYSLRGLQGKPEWADPRRQPVWS